jgi:hypothetical protein
MKLKKLPYYFGLVILLCGCAKDKFSVPAATDVIALGVNPNPVPADSFSAATISVKVDSSSVALQNDVVFSCTAGTFSNNTASFSTTLDLHGAATAYLKSATALDVTVTVTIHALYSKQVVVHFSPSYPDALTLTLPDSVKNISGLKVPLTANLLKQQGAFISGIPIIYSATNDQGLAVGSFNNNRASNATGNASVDFYLNDPTYKGNIFITGYFIDGNKNMIKATNQMLVY